MVENEFAKALYDLAKEAKLVDEVSNELNLFSKALEENPDFYKVMEAPGIDNLDKKESIKKITNNMCELLTNFLYVVIDHNRFYLIKEINVEFQKLVTESKNILDVEVISAKALTKEELDKIVSALQTRFGGKKVEVVNSIDEKLIGGVQVIYGGESFDISVKNRLDQLKASL